MSTRLRRSLFLRGLGAVHVVAAGSLWTQAAGQFGVQGIAPFDQLLGQVAESSPHPYVELPTLLWFAPTAAGLDGLFAAHCSLGLLLAVGLAPEAWLLLGLYATWVSISNVGGLFLGYQWDALLAETTVAALFVARFRPGDREPPVCAWWLVWFLLARLMFFGGKAKLDGGDPTWRDGTALMYHYWTQPLPNPLSMTFHRLPAWFHQVSVGLMFAVELLLPWFILLGRSGRRLAFAGFSVLLLLLMASGNFGYFQLLGLVLCASLLDDDDLLLGVPGPAPGEMRRAGHWLLPAALAWLGVVLAWHQGRFQRELHPWHLTARYGLFANMTTERPEVRLEGTWDGRTWTEIPTRWTPDDPTEAPRQVAPHMPRLDWQLWFAGLGTCNRNPWLVWTMQEVAAGNPAVTALFAMDPASEPPQRVRARVANYRPAAAGSDAVWEVSTWRPFCPFDVGPDGPLP